MRRALLLAAALLGAGPAIAQVRATPAVTSSRPERVSVTVYRNPDRQRWQRMELQWLGGFALVTERRTVRLPAGPATLRFEGVAGGIVPASAIVTGLPGGVVEKNRDARLLSPAALVDGTLGRRVRLRRTDRASGAVREEEAEIVAGPEGGVVVRTAAGVEALGCSGLAEKPLYPRVPAGLSAEPVLSVATVSPRAATATVTLSYLASGFDWSASYVATLRPDGRAIDLFAWLTLANANAQGFRAADVQAVAGRLERRGVAELARAVEALSLRCYPLGTTSDVPAIDREEIVVTASRMTISAVAMSAPPPPPVEAPPPPPPPEDLGDLKLYRVPERVTVAAKAQKQVALLAAGGVPFERVYRLGVIPGQVLPSSPTRVSLRMRNVAEQGLGIALPAGTTTLYAGREGGGRVLLGAGTLPDQAAGERVRLAAGGSAQVRVAQRVRATPGGGRRMTVTVANANPRPVTVEVPIGGAGDTGATGFSAPVERVDGVRTWIATVHAGGRATLEYRVER